MSWCCWCMCVRGRDSECESGRLTRTRQPERDGETGKDLTMQMRKTRKR